MTADPWSVREKARVFNDPKIAVFRWRGPMGPVGLVRRGLERFEKGHASARATKSAMAVRQASG